MDAKTKRTGVWIFLGIIALAIIINLLTMTGKMTEEDKLSKYVTKQGGTEQPFNNAYWDEKRPGIYVDYNTGKPLFSSLDKYDSGTGWPSFTKPIDDSAIKKEIDTSLGLLRTEVKTDASHLGHVFPDGPGGGSRFCINSAALKFIPYEELEEKGYEKYKELFPYEEAVLAGGCFWGVEHLLEQQEGIIETISGYTGGKTKNPTYEKVSTGKTGYTEAVLVIFDPKIISYEQILGIFWRLHNPTELNRQGPDIGTQYRSAIFYMNENQKNTAEQSKKDFDSKKVFSSPAVTEIVEFKKFYKAEEYHQNYVDNHPNYVCHVLRDE